MKQYQKDLTNLYRNIKRIPIPEADNPLAPKVVTNKVIDYLGNNQTISESVSANKGPILNSPEILARFPWAR